MGNGNGKSGSVRGEISVTDQHIVTSLMRAAEPLAAAVFPLPPRPTGITFAAVEDDDEALLSIPSQEFATLVSAIHNLMTRDTGLATLATEVRQAFGDGETLKMLFQRLFPGQHARVVRRPDGSPLLTAREVEVLKEVAADRTHEEIGKRLGLSPRTVSTHLNHIYAKLNVQRPIQAVARAISMGYLEMSALDVVMGAASAGPRNYNLFDTVATNVQNLGDAPAAQHLRPLAEFGMLLMLLAGQAEAVWQAQEINAANLPFLICEIDRRGEIIRSFGADRLRGAGNVVIAPPSAAKQGFTPGNLYIAHGLGTSVELNDCAVSEFTPDGRFVRTFGGGREIGTRLTSASGIAFHPDGRLLVPSGGWTDAILAFRNGGASVRRFINLCSMQVTLGPGSQLYATYASSAGGALRVYDAEGKPTFAFAQAEAGIEYTGMAVNSRGHVWAIHRKSLGGGQYEDILQEFGPDGTLLRSLPIPGLSRGFLSVDARDRLYVPCGRSGEVWVLRADGQLEQRINLRGKVVPLATTVTEDGGLWVVGQVG